MASRSNGNRQGRKKIKIEKLENQSNLQVTFSKRKKGAFKKAHELTILTGAEVALIVFSPGGKVYTYGHPTVEAVTNRFVTMTSPPQTQAQQQFQNEKKQKVAAINANLSYVKSQLEFETNRAKALDSQLAQSPGNHQSDANLDGDNLKFQDSLVALKNINAEVERELIARFLRGPQNRSIPAPILNASEDTNFQFPVDLSGYSVANSGGGVPSREILGFHGPNSGWPVNVGMSSNSYNEPNLFGLNSFDRGSSGKFIAGLGSLYGGGGGFPNTNGASSSGVKNGSGFSNDRVFQCDHSKPPYGFGGAQ